MNWKDLMFGLALVVVIASTLMIGPGDDAMRKAGIQALANEAVLPAVNIQRAVEHDRWIYVQAHRLINGDHFSDVFPDMMAETSYSIDYDNCVAVMDLLVDIIHTQKGLLSEMNKVNMCTATRIMQDGPSRTEYTSIINVE